MSAPQRIAMIGTVGVPAIYGGFETLVENLAVWHEAQGADGSRAESLTIYCSARAYEEQPDSFHGAQLRYLPLCANGAQSIPYDIWSMLSAVWRGHDTLLILGVSGALFLPVIRLISGARIVCNIDGVEWKRAKWGWLQRRILKWSEAFAVRFAHEVIADNGAIADHVRQSYGREAHVIAYGGDHALAAAPAPVDDLDLPARYAFKVCRIEPENNVEMVLEAFEHRADCPVVLVGNWDKSDYGQALRTRFAEAPGVRMLDPIYEPGRLHALRDGAEVFVHGHSAGGTNPSLVEMMFFGKPVFAYDCSFNRHSTDNAAIYFTDAADLQHRLDSTPAETRAKVGAAMKSLAQDLYTWEIIGQTYFDLLRHGPKCRRATLAPTKACGDQRGDLPS